MEAAPVGPVGLVGLLGLWSQIIRALLVALLGCPMAVLASRHLLSQMNADADHVQLVQVRVIRGNRWAGEAEPIAPRVEPNHL